MYELVEVKDLRTLEPGTHIAVQSLFKNLHTSLKVLYPIVSNRDYYYHHGVFLGDSLKNGEKSQVIHFAGQTTKDAKLYLIGIDQFKKRAVDRKLYRAQYNDLASVLPVGETLKSAKDVLRGAERRPKFDIVSNNCESLATWLKTGKAFSIQGRNGIIRASFISTCIGAGVGATFLKSTNAVGTCVFVGLIFPLVVSKVVSSNNCCSGCHSGNT